MAQEGEGVGSGCGDESVGAEEVGGEGCVAFIVGAEEACGPVWRWGGWVSRILGLVGGRVYLEVVSRPWRM